MDQSAPHWWGMFFTQQTCYETLKEERISRAFENLIDNIKSHNRAKL